VNGITAEELMDCLEAAGSRHDAAVLERLWASVPPGMRLPRLSAGTVPEFYRGGFAEGNPAGWPCHSEMAPPSTLIWTHLEG
jgi:hypothetical protein